MKLTPKTIGILKSFYNINANIRFTPGNIIRTVSGAHTILAQAKVDVEFPKKFCISDLSRFLHTIGLFSSEAELSINDKTVDISDKSTKVTYVCAPENTIAVPSDKALSVGEDAPYQFNLSKEDLAQLFKATSILGLTDVAVVGDGSQLQVVGLAERVHDTYNLNLGTTSKTFKAIFSIDNLNKLIPGDYEIKIDKILDSNSDPVNVSHFKNLSEDVDYWIVVSSQSQL